MLGFSYAVEILAGLAVLVVYLYFYLTKNYGYWKNKGVPFIEPRVPFGILTPQVTGKADTGTVYNEIYVKYKKQGLKYIGAFTFTQPTLIVLDLDLCKQVLTKDFNHFMNRDMTPTSHEHITKHLFSLEGKEWKEMRTKLTPTFTSGKMKTMFLLMEKCVDQLVEHVDTEVLKVGEFEVKNLIARLTTDIIATCAFGLDVNSIKDKENSFFTVGQKIFEPKMVTIFKMLYYKCFPITASIIKVNIFDQSISDMMTKVIKDTVEYRKKNNVSRNDFVDLLMKVRDNKSLEDHEDISGHPAAQEKTDKPTRKSDQSNHDSLTLEEMTAQAFVFFAAGFETAASTTSFCLYELAKNPEVQERLRREIDEVLDNNGGKITYQALQEMGYMEQVMNETLRMYASLPFLTRICTEAYRIPGSDVVIDAGVRVSIPTYAFHHDPEIYPDPYKFDPDRFSQESSKDRHHYAFTPFGEGPRICIGMRFGKLQVKIGLAAILSRYELSPAPDTPAKLELDNRIPFTTSRHPFKLRIAKRSDL